MPPPDDAHVSQSAADGPGLGGSGLGGLGGDGPVAGGPDAGESECFTIDELAARSGVPSRTIRFYQSKGTLPAPERRGRVAYYGHEHLERLRVIAELQDRGLRLDAIRDALAEVGRAGQPMSLQEWLGMGDELQAPWSSDRAVVLSEAELLDRLEGRPGLIGELRRLKIIYRRGDSRPPTYVVPSAILLDISIDLALAGIDPFLAYQASEIMRRQLAVMAEDLVRFWSERIGDGFAGSGRPEEIARAVEVLRRQGQQALAVLFAHEIERSLRELVEAGGAMPLARRGSAPDDEGEPGGAPGQQGGEPDTPA